MYECMCKNEESEEEYRQISSENRSEAGLTVLLTQVGYELIHKYWLC